MAAVFGKVLKDKATLDNGTMVRQKDLEFIFQSSETDMKENFKTPKSKALEHKDIIMAKLMSENIVKIVQMVRDNTFGLMETTTKDNLSIT